MMKEMVLFALVVIGLVAFFVAMIWFELWLWKKDDDDEGRSL